MKVNIENSTLIDTETIKLKGATEMHMQIRKHCIIQKYGTIVTDTGSLRPRLPLPGIWKAVARSTGRQIGEAATITDPDEPSLDPVFKYGYWIICIYNNGTGEIITSSFTKDKDNGNNHKNTRQQRNILL